MCIRDRDETKPKANDNQEITKDKPNQNQDKTKAEPKEKDNVKEKVKDKDNDNSVVRFTPPTKQDVMDYCQEKGYTDVDVERFMNYYTLSLIHISRENRVRPSLLSVHLLFLCFRK